MCRRECGGSSHLELECLGNRREGPAHVFGSCQDMQGLISLGIWKVWGQVGPGLRLSRQVFFNANESAVKSSQPRGIAWRPSG